MRSLAEWLELQQGVHPSSIDLGLDRVRAVAARLGLEQPACPVWTVGGTNGKGSTVAFLDALLGEAGRLVGAFTSPHLVRYNERIRIGGTLATDAELVAAFEAIDAARGATTLTFFEFNALAALWLFRERRVDAIVLEVGLGGRLDAANLVDATVAVICSIGLDHRDWLGDTLEDIGREKAGIVRAGRPVVLATPDLPRSVHQAIESVGAIAWLAGRDYRIERLGERWSWQGGGRRYDDLPPPALAGDVQYANAAAAIAALVAVDAAPPVDGIARALERVSVPGRFQVVPGPVEWILDVAHNEPAARLLADNLAARAIEGRTLAVAGFLGDKDVEAIGAALRPCVDAWFLADLAGPRGLGGADVARRLGLDSLPAVIERDVGQACARARAAAQPGDRVVVFGSFHVVGPALAWLGLY